LAKSRSAPATAACPCGSKAIYADCCGQAHLGQRPAATAEALMRSRYSAYVLRLADYLLDTWLPETRPASIEGLDEPRWLRLRIEACTAGSSVDDLGSVRFTAHYTLNGRAHRLQEHSRFERVAGRWYYRDGDGDGDGDCDGGTGTGTGTDGGTGTGTVA
jgi:SEC-C motif-containing protein